MKNIKIHQKLECGSIPNVMAAAGGKV